MMLALVLGSGAMARAAETALTPEERLGWQMAIHERTFQNFTVFECMDKTAALGLKYMSFSAGIKLDGPKAVALQNLTDAQIQKIKDYGKGKGITFVNAYVP